MATKQIPLSFAVDSNKRTHLDIPNGTSLLVIDNISAPGVFLTLNFVSKALKNGRPVILVNFTDSETNWDSLLQKQGVLPASVKKRLYKYVSGLPIIQDDHETGSKLRVRLCELIEREVVGMLESDMMLPPLLVIDDLTTLLWLGESVDDLITMSQYLSGLQSTAKISLLIIFHTDRLLPTRQPNRLGSSYTIPDRHLRDELIDRSDVVIRTRSLGAQGLGELLISRGPSYILDPQLPVTLSLDLTTQYRIDDNSVTYYPKGLDKGFI